MSNPLSCQLTVPRAKHADGARTFQGIPSLAVTPGGRIWVTFYSGGETECKENFVLLYKSDDRGESWQGPLYVVDPPAEYTRAYDAALWCDPAGHLHWYWAESTTTLENCIFDGYAGVWHAELSNPDDPWNNFQWSLPRRIANGVMLNKPTILHNGVWALPVAFWKFGPYNFPEMQPYIGAGLIATADGGENYEFRGRARVISGNIFDEHMFIELSNHDIRVYIRTEYGFAESESTDGGYNWSAPRPSVIPGPNSRLFIRRLRSGRLLLAANRVSPENPKERRALCAWLSDDEGKSWHGELMLDERVAVSYPDGDQLADGTICVVYDWERFREGDILMARFTEADVEAGRIVSPDSKLRMLVNHSGGLKK